MRLRKNVSRRKKADEKKENKNHITIYLDLAGSKIVN